MALRRKHSAGPTIAAGRALLAVYVLGMLNFSRPTGRERN